MESMPLQPFLPYARFRFHVKVTTEMVLPPYKGAVFRSAFGATFKRVVCVAPRAECSNCLIQGSCKYLEIFKTAPPPNFPDAGKFAQASRPYVLNPPLTSRCYFNPGEILEFDLVVLGSAVKSAPYLILTFADLGLRFGLGPKRGKYELLKVELFRDEEAITVYTNDCQDLLPCTPQEGPVRLPDDDCVAALELDFITPLRLKAKEENNTKVKGKLVTRLTFAMFFQRLIHRLNLLTSYYGYSSYLPDFAQLQIMSQEINVVRNQLFWDDWGYYSRSKNEERKFGGLKGRMILKGRLGPLMPFLRLGTQVNVGQETTFGLGRYKMKVLEC
jgi:hypothetical protein